MKKYSDPGHRGISFSYFYRIDKAWKAGTLNLKYSYEIPAC